MEGRFIPVRLWRFMFEKTHIDREREREVYTYICVCVCVLKKRKGEKKRKKKGGLGKVGRKQEKKDFVGIRARGGGGEEGWKDGFFFLFAFPKYHTIVNYLSIYLSASGGYIFFKEGI